MAQVLKLTTQLGATNFNGKAVDLGGAGTITTGSTGGITANGGTVTLGSTANACTASIPNGSLTLGTSTVAVPLTLNGPMITPSANYAIVTSATPTSPIGPGVAGVIFAVALTSKTLTIDFPTSPVDGQTYTIAFPVTQTTPNYTLSATTVPDLSTPLTNTITAPVSYTFLYKGTSWYVISS